MHNGHLGCPIPPPVRGAVRNHRGWLAASLSRLPRIPRGLKSLLDTSCQKAEQDLRRKFGALLNNARVPAPVAIKWSQRQMTTGICVLKSFILGSHGNLSLLLGGKEDGRNEGHRGPRRTLQPELPELLLPSGGHTLTLGPLEPLWGQGGGSAISHVGSAWAPSHRRGNVGLGDSMASSGKV